MGVWLYVCVCVCGGGSCVGEYVCGCLCWTVSGCVCAFVVAWDVCVLAFLTACLHVWVRVYIRVCVCVCVCVGGGSVYVCVGASVCACIGSCVCECFCWCLCGCVCVCVCEGVCGCLWVPVWVWVRVCGGGRVWGHECLGAGVGAFVCVRVWVRE